MLKDTKSLGNNKAPACESRGFVAPIDMGAYMEMYDVYPLVFNPCLLV